MDIDKISLPFLPLGEGVVRSCDGCVYSDLEDRICKECVNGGYYISTLYEQSTGQDFYW